MIAALSARSVVAITGEDRVPFLQGLVSNDVADAAPGRAVWAALLTPQGKWLADFFIFSDGERLLLDCERAQSPMLRQRLSRYRLRSRVVLAETELQVFVAWNGAPAVDGIVARDPRLAEAGWRMLSAEQIAVNATEEEWDLHRVALGLPDGSRDMESEKSILLEAGFDELNGVSLSLIHIFIAFVRSGPRNAASAIARIRNGQASIASTMRDNTASTQPPESPANSPDGTPIPAAISTCLLYTSRCV